MVYSYIRGNSANESNSAEDDGNDYDWYDDGDDLMYIGLREPWLLCGTVTSPRWTRRRHKYPTVRQIQAFDEGNSVDNENDCDRLWIFPTSIYIHTIPRKIPSFFKFEPWFWVSIGAIIEIIGHLSVPVSN